jgi:hypothetical protein
VVALVEEAQVVGVEAVAGAVADDATVLLNIKVGVVTVKVGELVLLVGGDAFGDDVVGVRAHDLLGLTFVASLTDPDDPEDGLVVLVLGVEELHGGVSVILRRGEREEGCVFLLGDREDGGEDDLVVSKKSFVKDNYISTKATNLILKSFLVSK